MPALSSGHIDDSEERGCPERGCKTGVTDTVLRQFLVREAGRLESASRIPSSFFRRPAPWSRRSQGYKSGPGKGQSPYRVTEPPLATGVVIDGQSVAMNLDASASRRRTCGTGSGLPPRHRVSRPHAGNLVRNCEQHPRRVHCQRSRSVACYHVHVCLWKSFTDVRATPRPFPTFCPESKVTPVAGLASAAT